MSGSAACADVATGRIRVRSRVDGLTNALADLGSDRLAVGAGTHVLVVRPKPACGG